MDAIDSSMESGVVALDKILQPEGGMHSVLHEVTSRIYVWFFW